MEILFRELQHCNAATASATCLSLCRAPVSNANSATSTESGKINRRKLKISCKVFVNRNRFSLPLQCQIEKATSRSLRVKIARIKSGNCAH